MYCKKCGCNCEAKTIDEGIGPYEYWGARGNDVQLVQVSDCCEAEILDYRPCNCGSGLPREAEYDGYGIFLCYLCDKCRKEKMKGYRQDIYERYETDECID